MARTVRGRKLCYDNVAVGSVMGTERTISGASAPAEVIGAGSNIAVASAYPTTVIADDIAIGVVTLTGERLG